MALSEAAKEAKREYHRGWRDRNREHYRNLIRDWQRNNKEKVKAAQARYWERKAEKNI